MKEFFYNLKDIVDYITNNTLLTTLIGVIVGWMLNLLASIILSKIERKNRKEDELEREKRIQFDNKAELNLEKVKDNGDFKPQVEVFLCPFNVKYLDKKRYKVEYPDEINDMSKYKYKDYVFRNIGNSDINELSICVTNKYNTLLIDYNSLDIYLKNSDYIDCSVTYDKKVLKNKTWVIRVYFLEDYEICNLLTCTLLILFKDSYNNYYRQPFWYEKDNIYPPIPIGYSSYYRYIKIDDVYDYYDNSGIYYFK